MIKRLRHPHKNIQSQTLCESPILMVGNCFLLLQPGFNLNIWSHPLASSKETIIFLSGQHTVNQTRSLRMGSKSRFHHCEGQLDIAAMKYCMILSAISIFQHPSMKIARNFDEDLYKLHNSFFFINAKSFEMNGGHLPFFNVNVWGPPLPD